jgi:hypothetical protein
MGYSILHNLSGKHKKQQFGLDAESAGVGALIDGAALI